MLSTVLILTTEPTLNWHIFINHSLETFQEPPRAALKLIFENKSSQFSKNFQREFLAEFKISKGVLLIFRLLFFRNFQKPLKDFPKISRELTKYFCPVKYSSLTDVSLYISIGLHNVLIMPSF